MSKSLKTSSDVVDALWGKPSTTDGGEDGRTTYRTYTTEQGIQSKKAPLDTGSSITGTPRSYQSSKSGSNEKKPATLLASEIVRTARRKAHDAESAGDIEGGIGALEEALQIIMQQWDYPSDSLRMSEAEIFLELGMKDAARHTLSHCKISPNTRTLSTPQQNPSSQRRGSITDSIFSKQMAEFNQQQTQDQEKLLQALLQAEDWKKAREAAAELHCIDRTAFDIEKPMDRFQKCRQLLAIGLLEETSDLVADNDKTRLGLGKALRNYNHGCYATELFHKYLDPPEGQVINGFDHRDCTNLFFSAARICVLFHQKGIFDRDGTYLTPIRFTRKFRKDDLPCSPALTESSWDLQALHFMEQGRSRALRELILKQKADESNQQIVTVMQRRYLMKHAVSAATQSNRIKKSRDTYRGESDAKSTSIPSQHQNDALLGLTNITPPSPSNIIPISDINTRKDARPLAIRALLDTPGLDDYKTPNATIPSPSSYDGSDMTSEHPRLGKEDAQLRWQKAILYALAVSNPTLNAAIPKSSFLNQLSSIGAKIPKDTAIIEYALVQTSLEGLISVVITPDGIQECIWQKTDKLKRRVLELLECMQSYSTSSRDASPTSPRRDIIQNALELCATLRNILIKPLERHIHAKQKLIIIPSGELVHVPWSIMLSKPVSIVPSLSIWDHLVTHTQTSRSSSTPLRVSVVGNPPRTSDGSLVASDIPYAHFEAFYIARMHRSFPLLTKAHGKDSFRPMLPGSHILHLCAHSTFNASHPSLSSIHFFGNALTVADWRKLEIKADLVIFSSCLSAVSKAFHSGSAFGFAHTLLSTGTRAFIGSLWPVDDLATLLLMMMFYEELVKCSPAEALHRAQMRMKNIDLEDIMDLVEKIKEVVEKEEKIREYVDNHRYWIRKLDNLGEEDLKVLREERCWAAFGITGYGFQEI